MKYGKSKAKMGASCIESEYNDINSRNGWHAAFQVNLQNIRDSERKRENSVGSSGMRNECTTNRLRKKNRSKITYYYCLAGLYECVCYIDTLIDTN